MDLRSTQLKDTYGNLVTTGTSAGSPTTGGLQNGDGALLTSVGIGTNDPSVELEVGGSSNTQVLISATNNTGNSQLYFGDSDSDTAGVILYRHNGDSMAFEVNDTERMRIGSGGDISFRDGSANEAFYWDASEARLGIGTDSPSAGLHVEQSGADVSIISRNTNNSASVATSSSLKLGITSTVGTHDSEIKVVEATVNSNGTNMEFYNQFNAISYKRMQIASGGDISFYDSTGSNPDFFWDASAGSLGIGTTSPDSTLHVQSSSGQGRLTIEAPSNEISLVAFQNTGSATKYTIGYNDSEDAFFFYDDVVNTERMRIDSSGNVGIGTAPDSILHAKGASAELRIENTTAGSSASPNYSGILFFQSNGTSVGASIQSGDQLNSNSNNNLIFTTRASGGGSHTEKLRITGDGNVGIGTDDPDAMLHLSKQNFSTTSVNNSIRITDTDVALSNPQTIGQIEFESKSTNDPGVVGKIEVISNEPTSSNSNGNILFYTGANATGLTERMRLNSSGALIINSNATSGAVTTNFKAFGNDSDSFVEVRNNTSNSADLRIVRSDSAEMFLANGHSGNLTIAGALSKGSGSFKIDHPLESKKDTHYLVHSFVESPQANNIYRGSVDLADGQATVNLDEVSGMTDGTFVLLNTDIHVYTSNESDWDAVKGSVSDNVLTIECQNSSSTAKVNWLVIGERHDQHMIETDWTDENGKVIVEPLKPIENELEN